MFFNNCFLVSGVGHTVGMDAPIDQRHRTGVNCAGALTDGTENLCENSTVVSGSALDGAGF